ncbi:K+-transporting ATPase ATPase C chain [Bacillus sp. OV166]|uniref:K(+)-transporting ATPase subunit C n=1 Tax=Bacillus sp. OV166 TaxID=1882763 RepID=UPI000A2ADE02|nr:K(+)-transporting ATPase subunit C [Bacillus sp. OV166]SMQ77794.1 K+-transporting ATPase ATPase C chain [Bacillus sp. OV166]
MTNISKTFRPALFIFIAMTILCGVVYTSVVTGIAQLIFPNQSNGSIVTVTLKDGTKKDVGSELIAQKFTEPKYLIGRSIGTTNLSPVSAEQEKLVQERIDWWHKFDPDNKSDIPMDLVTASGSGVDPYISPAAAEYQVSRIAKTRGISEYNVRKIINQYTTDRFLEFIGEPGVNVLKVNLALDGLYKG